jgi:multidrug efflux pump subunit AcrA (membrane-fusion protein)
MKQTHGITAAAVLLALALGWWAHDWLAPETASHPAAGPETSSPCPGGAAPLYWKAPMDPNYVRDAPGKSPMGMDLVPECPGAAAAGAPGEVRIDPGLVQKIGVRTAPAERRDLSRTVRAVGRIATDERRVAHVHTKVQGWVERLLVDYVGQEVRRGQPLLEIYSPELVATQEELLVAARYRGETRSSPFPDVSSSGDALYEATRRRLELWDIPESVARQVVETGKIQKTLTLYAPRSGVVSDLEVRTGMEVSPHQNLYTIADLSRVWVLADVYEYELPWIELGQRGQVELAYLPEQRFEGVVTYIAPFLDAGTRTAQVRLELENPEGRLKPQMFANVLIQGAPRAQAVAIPTEAVIRSGRRSIAVVALGEGRFEPREIEPGLSDESWTEVVSGVAAGEEVVVSGQFLIDSESRLQEALGKLLGRPDGSAEPVQDPRVAPEPDPHAGHVMPGGPE